MSANRTKIMDFYFLRDLFNNFQPMIYVDDEYIKHNLGDIVIFTVSGTNIMTSFQKTIYALKTDKAIDFISGSVMNAINGNYIDQIYHMVDGKVYFWSKDE